MTHHLTLITGASRGMGNALARQLLGQGHTVLCISRTAQDGLVQHAAQAGATLLQWTHDLADSAALGARLERWLQDSAKGPDGNAWASATLINNAGVLARIGPFSDTEADDLVRALRVGLEAPMQLTAVFLRSTQSWLCPHKVLNISSGLGRRAMASQAAYCTAKAGMDHFTRCLALDEALKANGAKVCSLAPGVIDTGMQRQLRGADEAAFPDRANFVNLKSSGLLASADDAASRVLAYLARPDFGAQPVADVRD